MEIVNPVSDSSVLSKGILANSFIKPVDGHAIDTAQQRIDLLELAAQAYTGCSSNISALSVSEFEVEDYSLVIESTAGYSYQPHEVIGREELLATIDHEHAGCAGSLDAFIGINFSDEEEMMQFNIGL